MRFGIAVPAYGKAVQGSAIQDLVVAAEELGFDSVWWPDHIAVPAYAAAVNLSPPFLEPLAACAWGLGATSRIRFGTDVLVAPYRHPLHVAAASATMASLGGDRLILGVGIGYLRGEFEVLGADYDARAADTERWIRDFRAPPDGYVVMSRPTPVPIWVGGNNPRAWQRAALHGDGWHPLWMPAEAYRTAREEIVALRQDAGLADQPFTFSFSAGATRFIDSPPAEWPAPAPRAAPGSEFRYAPEAWLAPDGRPRLTGTPDQLVGDLRALADAGVEQVTLRFGTTDTASLERFVREVRPAFATE
jgi:alkanesulfonate monooxygenase SsuD/methylene tetrahydromethanopterin reductase-like flavin-dependent oxidoreductase (luciferase family)